MRYLFDEPYRHILKGFLAKATVLAFDFDGTLAPIVSNRDTASMRGETLCRFVQLCELYPCAVVTGRSRQDVVTRLGSAKVWRVVGHHGLETDGQDTARSPEIALASRYLGQTLGNVPGIEIEDKGLSLAVHFRSAQDQQSAHATIHQAMSQLPYGLKVIDGKAVVNLVPGHAPDKGDAIVALRQEALASRVLYVGDDITDEDVFEIGQPSWLMTVRVGCSPHSKASYFVKDQDEVDRLLDELLRPQS